MTDTKPNATETPLAAKIVERPLAESGCTQDESEAMAIVDLYIASEGPYDDIYFYFYPYGLLY